MTEPFASVMRAFQEAPSMGIWNHDRFPSHGGGDSMATIDEIGPWSEVKLAIIRDYAAAYSRLLNATDFYPGKKAYYVYIDAFAGAGVHVARETGEYVPGSPTNALLVRPPFHEYHFIDVNQDKIDFLRDVTQGAPNVSIHVGDANAVLRELLPKFAYEDYKRVLCILDPYGLHYDWEVVVLAAQMKSVDLFLNFSILDANRNVLLKKPDEVDEHQAQRLTLAWGDDSWETHAYSSEGDLFGYKRKVSNEVIADLYRKRLKRIAGFAHVSEPLPIRNSNRAVMFYLYFAAQHPVALHIVQDIFRKYRRMGV